MAEDPALTMERRLEAGRAYAAALARLGFTPDVLCWATAPSEESRFELLLVTTWAETVGPKAIYDLLFEAYDAAATPRSIDPFIVTVFGARSRLGADLIGMLENLTLHGPRWNGALDRPMLVLGMMEYATLPEWVIIGRRPRSTRFEDQRRFAAFRRNVVRLAA